MPEDSDPARGGRSTPRSVIPSRWLWQACVVGLPVILVVRLVYYVFHDVADGMPARLPARVFEEVTGVVLAFGSVAMVAWLARRVPVGLRSWRHVSAVYAVAFAVITAVHTTAMVAVRAALGPMLGLGRYPLDFGAARYAYEAANDVLPFVAMVAGLGLAESVVARREHEIAAAELERSLLRTELTNLRLQLQPHFLFNALNTISATMYEDVEAADAQLGQLADLLRISLRTTHAHEVPVREELQLLAQYLELMRARFGDRLRLMVDAPDGVRDLLVPSMVLQPLVENAVRHGGISRLGHGAVTVTLRLTAASSETPALVLRVHDDGPPGDTVPPVEPLDGGTGLSATARRLRLLYGDAQSMRAGAAAEGGFEVVIRIPARSGTRAADSSDAGVSGAPRALGRGRP